MKKNNGRILIALNFMILMAALGASDSLRGIFAPAFQEQFSLNAVNLSMIVMVSYLGNLLFLFYGGRILDTHNRKKVALGVLAIWIAAIIIYLVTDSYLFLLVGMFLAMGSSTLLNTAVNILTPAIFISASGMMVNIFFFVQGIGTTVTQNLVGRVADSYQIFKLVNLLLAALGIVSFLMLWKSNIPDGRLDDEAENTVTRESVSFRTVMKQKNYWLLVLIFGCYFIAEHGIMNWLVAYGTGALELSASKASGYLSGFYGAITVGRLVWSPIVAKAGAFKSITWFGGIGTLLFVIGILTGESGLWILSFSGIAISILYPTMVYMLHSVYPANQLGAALGAVISAATLFDIGFNVLFGKLVDMIGYRISFMIIPLSMLAFYISYLIFSKRCTH